VKACFNRGEEYKQRQGMSRGLWCQKTNAPLGPIVRMAPGDVVFSQIYLSDINNINDHKKKFHCILVKK